MGYQSKTYSLSDEVVAVIDAAKARGETPNQLLRRVLLSGKAESGQEAKKHVGDYQIPRRTRPLRQKGGTKR